MNRVTVPIVALLATLVAVPPVGVATARTAPSGGASPTPAPQAVDPVAWSDFDDDGFQDLAIGAPGTADDAGSVFVLYGTSSGLSVDGADAWHQDSPSIVGVREAGDRFGWALASGDFDKDGVADLAIGVPGEDRVINGANRVDAGLVQVIYGVAGVGLSAAGDIAIQPRAGQFPTEAESLRWVDSEFGASLVALDRYDTVRPVDQAPDGFADLAIGAPGFDDGIGIMVALAGDDVALDPAFREWLDFDLFAFPEGTRAPATLAAGDLDGEGFDDIAIGCPLCDVDSHANAGMVIVTSFEVSIQFLSEGSGGNRASPRRRALFGAARAAGDFNGDGIDELAVGVPGKDFSGSILAGQVQIYTGSAGGLGAPVRTVDERAAAVPSQAVSLERFGASLAVGQFGRGAGLDLAVGAPGERVGSVSGAGAVFVMYNTGTGLSAVDSQRWTQNTQGIPNSSETNDRFGDPLAVGEFRRGGTHDLVIGVELEDLPGNNALANAGLVHVLYGKSNGLTASDDQAFSTSSLGQASLAETRFGAALR